MHVDGFRFDLGTTLARPDECFDDHSAFLIACIQDPVLAHVKLIAEPWDCGPGGYQMGRFPPGWAEWNDKFRDARPRFLAQARRRPACSPRALRVGGPLQSPRPQAVGERQLRHRARRLHAARPGQLRREAQRGQRRGQRRRQPDNRSGNYGVEGPTDDPAIVALRAAADAQHAGDAACARRARR